MRKRWVSRVRMALAVIRARATGRRWFVQWDGDVWQVIDD